MAGTPGSFLGDWHHASLAGLWTVLGSALWMIQWHGAAADPTGKQSKRKVFGLQTRVPWTTSKVIGSPEPPPARHRPGARSARLGDVPPFSCLPTSCTSCPRSNGSNNRPTTNLFRSAPPLHEAHFLQSASDTSTSALKRPAASTDQGRHCLNRFCGSASPAWRHVPRPDPYHER
jgi:hypothetical protein